MLTLLLFGGGSDSVTVDLTVTRIAKIATIDRYPRMKQVNRTARIAVVNRTARVKDP